MSVIFDDGGTHAWRKSSDFSETLVLSSAHWQFLKYSQIVKPKLFSTKNCFAWEKNVSAVALKFFLKIIKSVINNFD